MLGMNSNPNTLRTLLVNGIKKDRRFMHVCSMMLLTHPKPPYNEFKESIQSIETENEIERTMMNTLERSVDRMRLAKSANYRIDKSNVRHGDRISINSNMEHVKCYKCNEFGHYQKDCPHCDSDVSVSSNVNEL
jgi:hypothetical protein